MFRGLPTLFPVVGLLSALAVSACDSPTYYRPLSFGVEPIEAAWSAGFAGKVGLIELHNLPASASADAIAADASSPQRAAPAAGFTTDRAKASDPRYRMVLIFGASPAFDGADACGLQAEGATVASTASAGQDVQAALCAGTEAVSEIRVSAHPELNLGDGNRVTDRQILADIAQHLYRPTTEQESDGGCSLLNGC